MAINRFVSDDDSIHEIREQYPEGLHFVVGDVHGEAPTLRELMKKIAFIPDKDHVFFVGDYNGGGSPHALLEYISLYYQEDFTKPGFHLIRGNHEWELGPLYPLDNLPDILVYKGEQMNYFITHAGMVARAFHQRDQDILLGCFILELSCGTADYLDMAERGWLFKSFGFT